MIIVDFDDYAADNHRLDLLHKLKEINPLFKCTVFAIPNKMTLDLFMKTPDWIELAVHGWDHPHPRECESWSYERMQKLIDDIQTLQNLLNLDKFVKVWKSPGWQTSDAIFQCLLDNNWAIADQEYNNNRRPKGLKTYLLGPNSHHGHIQNVCGNGLEETFDQLVERIKDEDDFRFVREMVKLWN